MHSGYLHARPVEATVTSSRAIGVLEAVVEAESDGLGCLAASAVKSEQFCLN